jgi:hypothetical protein
LISLGILVRPPTVKPAGPTHGEAPQPKALTWGIGFILAAILLGSAVGLTEDGRLGLSSRWDESFHEFTWDAGLKAMGKTGVGR